MANQKTSDLRRVTSAELAPGDLFSVVDVSEPTTPTGENKTITANDLAQNILANYTATGSRFTARYSTSTSNYLVNSSGNNVVLPERYVLTSVVVETTGKPLLSLGTSYHTPAVSSSITGSWNDNRVYPTSASYDVNYLELSTYGSVHPARTVWCQFLSGSDCPCTFSFDGFSR